MENFTPDLNVEWCEEEETVPCTQDSETWGFEDFSYSQLMAHNAKEYFSQTDVNPSIHTLSNKSVAAVRSPLASIGNITPSQKAEGKSKLKIHRGKKASTISTRLAAPLVNTPPATWQSIPIGAPPKGKRVVPTSSQPITPSISTPPAMPQTIPQPVLPRGKRASATSSQFVAPLVKTPPANLQSAPLPQPPSIYKEDDGKASSEGGKPVPANMFFRSGNWTIKETATLLDARAKLFEDMKNGSLNAVLKTGDERWEFISKVCVQHGVLRSPDQCLFRWDRISALFKKVHDYQRQVPSGCDSYWNMSLDKREEMKLPRNFAEDLYTTMLDRIGKERLINPGDIVYDTMQDIVGDSTTSQDKDGGSNKKDGNAFMDEESLTGKKRKRGEKMSMLKKELEGTTNQLISFMNNIDARRAKHEDDVVELTKVEFEEVVTLNRKRLALEEESNEALRQIADAFKCFAMHASSYHASTEKHSF